MPSSSAFSTFKRKDVPNEYLAFGLLNIITLNLILGVVSLLYYPQALKAKKAEEDCQKEFYSDEHYEPKSGNQTVNKNQMVSRRPPRRSNLPVFPKYNYKALIILVTFVFLAISIFSLSNIVSSERRSSSTGKFVRFRLISEEIPMVPATRITGISCSRSATKNREPYLQKPVSF